MNKIHILKAISKNIMMLVIIDIKSRIYLFLIIFEILLKNHIMMKNIKNFLLIKNKPNKKKEFQLNKIKMVIILDKMKIVNNNFLMIKNYKIIYNLHIIIHLIISKKLIKLKVNHLYIIK